MNKAMVLNGNIFFSLEYTGCADLHGVVVVFSTTTLLFCFCFFLFIVLFLFVCLQVQHALQILMVNRTTVLELLELFTYVGEGPLVLQQLNLHMQVIEHCPKPQSCIL